MISAEQADFTVWLDEQFTKIDSFYKEKEKEAVERYLMLQDQLFNLREQKISARVAKAQVKPHMLNIPSNPTATKIKKKIARKIDLPSLPASIHNALFSHTKQDHDKQSKLEDEYAEDSEGVSRDYVKRKRDDDRISYTVARRQIKIAIGEFYRSLELLKSYRTLNQTAFRKMTKKFDKMTGRSLQKPYMEKINSAYFCQSEIADDLIRKTEDMFAMYFENGNHKHAVEKLRAKTVPEEHYSEMFITGLSYGLSVPLLIQGIVKGIVTRRSVTSITTPEAFRSSHRATTDEEAQVPGVQMPPREDDPTTTTTDPGAAVAAGADKPAKSTFSTIATPVIQALSFALRNAHTRDFQRRKDSVGSTESGHNRSKVDSDDDNTDDDDDDDEGGDTSSVRFGADGALRQRDINQTSGHGPTSSSFAQPSSIQWRDQYL
ncbi:hypothetical protein D0Z00_002788 [Geotrichum galactomycetum]|uniref:Uncharacterized protein n=1 Tax=Geotrichum galactomycetum TaxID=27317 RepID=A0ACB6V358_9ASCO|nr:hypothetical protein D0Z00_002788 [Geotrichum candidum]